ncbi:related to A.gambiae ATP-binding-cassette protein [Saccharomycodes ludwigii]|uniref:Related to A.gambiae ATP-binding-cassette protein n=1 Tax=Saccharomycodes ludwigii TaxID=36035 RepID=A0A376BB58_9ASCO|nr:related to A.gambiae ATP-binding-cassette protein [Saccharomycodes ludwigii]
MFLDEPTTGLDSYTAILLMQTLNKLSSQYGTTFILSIHQPRSDIFEKMLDQLIILSTGNLIYTGKVNNMVGYFTQYCDLPLPSKFLNPCDYYIDCCSIDTRSEEMRLKSCAVLKKLAQKWQYYAEQQSYTEQQSCTPTTSIAQNYKFVSSSVGFIEQVKVQFFRSLKLSIRDKLTFFGSLSEPIIIGLVNGWIYYRPVANNKTQDPTILRTITASIYTGAALQSYLVLIFETYRLCEVDMKMYDMERLKVNRVVTPQSFFVARKLSKFLIEDFPIPLIFSIITYFMFGLDESHGENNNTCKNFFIYFSVTLLMHQTSTNLALISVSLSRNFSQASLVGNLAYTLQSFACGFFVNAAKMPVYVRWTKYITFLWVSFGALLSNEFTSKSNSTYTGLLNSLGFPSNWITDPIVILFCWVIGMGGVVICLLHLKTIDISQVNSNVKFKNHSDNKNENKKSSSSDLEKVEEIQVDKISELHKEDVGVDVELRNINLKVNTNKKETIQILNDINAKFVKNKVNVIMGPSGSGKSTLLNYMANRLNSNDSFFQFSKQYKYTGQIVVDDGEIVTDNVNFSKMCSYVKQNDDHLLSRLTVWETLYYASKLRLTHLSDTQQKQQVEDIIMSLGLWHCKDTLVGDEWNKGISGGEKRRVSIGVQLLTRPKVVILDEPTSGLDSFTASTIMELLHKISHNTTVIVTIHQPRAEMFYKFGNVLLIAKGGYVVFNGTPTEMETFFFSNPNLRFRCPELTNIADFYLDLISLNTQNEVNEGISRKRVDKIINEWNKESQGMYSEIADTKSTTIIVDGDRKAGFLTGYKVCLARQFKCIIRDINPLVARFTQVPGISIILALYFAPLKHNEISITNRLGLVQQSSSLYFTGMLSNLAVYPQERDAFYHEYADGVFTTASSFFLAYMTLELPMSALASIIYSCFSVLVVGLPRTASNFFITVYGVFVFMACGESLGILTNTLFEQPGFVVNIISIIISIGCGMSGLMSLKMDKVLKGFNYLSPLNYITVSLINYAFPPDLKIVLDNGDTITGPEVLKEYGLVRNNRNWLGAGVVCWFIYRLLAYIVLYIKLHKR